MKLCLLIELSNIPHGNDKSTKVLPRGLLCVAMHGWVTSAANVGSSQCTLGSIQPFTLCLQFDQCAKRFESPTGTLELVRWGIEKDDAEQRVAVL